jgi:signal transduction histidine kinase
MSSQSTTSHRTRRRPRTGTPRTLAVELRALDGVFGERQWRDRRALAQARRRARERAHAALEGADGRPDRIRLALRLAAAHMLVATSGELSGDPAAAGMIVAEIEELLEVEPLDLALDVIRAPELLALAPPLAIRAQLTMLAAFGGLRSVSLWRRDAAERTLCSCHVGEGEPTSSARGLASQVLAGDGDEAQRRRLLVGVPVGGRAEPIAALVGTASAGTRMRARRLMEELGPLLAAVLERDALLTHNAESQRSLIESSERKLMRLGFDLHDGPIQDVAVLAEDVRLLRAQVGDVVGPARTRELIRGRFEDLEAQMTGVDAQLRRLSNEVNAASVLLNRPFDRALRDRVDAFTARTGIVPRVRLSGEMDRLTTSQQIALLNIVQESLNNIREHSGAGQVQLAIAVSDAGVTATIEDDGKGFDLESTLMRTAREGRVGLLAIHERARLLGGRCRIQSRPGGPTLVSVALDLYRPIADGPSL